MQTLQIQHFSQTFVPIQALTYNSTAYPILMNRQKLEMVRHLFSLSDFWFKHDSIIYLLLHQNNIVQKIVQLFVQYQKYIIQQKYLVMRSKQDELLQKLQKCVGRIDGRPSLTERHNYRQQIASSFADTTYSRGLNEKKYNHEATNDSYRDKQPIKSENRRLKWNCDQENMYPSASINQTKSTRNSVSKNNLTDRKYLQNIGESKENVRIDVQDTKFRYMQNQRKTEGQAGRKLNNYLEADKPRRPLREYQVNLDSSKLNQSYQLEPKQTRSYLQQDSGRKYQISATPKYDEYRTGETYDKNQTPTYRRNSVSFSESFKKSSNKLGLQAKMQDDGKNNKQSFNYEAYDYLKQKKQIQPFNPNLYNKTNRNNCSIDNSNDQIQSRDSISQSKSRQIGAGSISSVIKRNNLESSKASCFEVYQGKDQKDLTIQRILDQVGSANQDTFTKLQKISELNDRINMRIKNIIQTFEAK